LTERSIKIRLTLMEPLHLLHFRISHFSEKVRWALDHKRCPHSRESMIPGFHIPRVRFLTGQNKLPVLLVDGEPIVGSSRILEELERRHPEPPLFPQDPAARARAMEIQRFFDDEVAPDLRTLFWSTYLDKPAVATAMATAGAPPAVHAVWRMLFPLLRPAFRGNLGQGPTNVARARAQMRGYFDRLESEIGPGGYLVGDTFGVADLCAAAMMTAILRPPQFPYPLPEPWPEELVDLRGSIVEHPAARWVLGIYERHRPGSAEVT
jgi:glutathione S-transferase